MTYEYLQLPEILKSITELGVEGNISFDAKDAIFLTNKWDNIRCEVDDEKARERTWDVLKNDIKSAWKAVNEENIFRMNLIEVNMNPCHLQNENHTLRILDLKFETCEGTSS